MGRGPQVRACHTLPVVDGGQPILELPAFVNSLEPSFELARRHSHSYNPVMDVVKAVETYITKMVSTPSAVKVLLLDSHTVRPI